MSRKDRIVIVAPETLPVPPILGGAVQTVIQEQSKRLDEFPITILSPGYPKLPSRERSGNLSIIRTIKMDITEEEGKGELRDQYVHAIQKELEKLHPDIVHVHNRPQFVLALSKSQPKAKIILHLHNDHLDRLPKREQKKILRACDRVLCVSKFLKRKIKRKHKFFKHKLVRVANGIDTEKFTISENSKKARKLRKKFGISSDDILLLYVGRIVPQKGLDEILKSLLLMEKKERKKVKLLVVGCSDFGTELKAPYEKQVRKLSKKLKGNVKFTGYVPHHKLVHYYQMADFCVAPMRWEEPFGLVIGEAAACGLPVIASRKGAIPEMIEHKKTGLLLPAKFTTKQLMKQIQFLSKQPQMCKKMGISARERIKKKFGWNQSSNRIKKIYRKLEV